MNHFLGIDIGGTKLAWGLFDANLQLSEHGRMPTPPDLEGLLAEIKDLATAQGEAEVVAIGLGIPGTHTKDRGSMLISPNIPYLNGVNILGELKVLLPGIAITYDNDARCALVGEVVAGAAKNLRNAVLITIGTGVGGAVLQRGHVLQHPDDITQELGHIPVDSMDAYTSPHSGRGTLEAFLGGKNLEERLDISLKEQVALARKDDTESLEIWAQIQEYMDRCLGALENTYNCETILVGGVASNDLDLYLGDHELPCKVIPTKLGELSGLYGAAQLALDAWHDAKTGNELWV